MQTFKNHEYFISSILRSGGPLYFTNGRQIVIGLISYGIGCGSTTPSVNSRITSYLPWISRITGDEYCRK